MGDVVNIIAVTFLLAWAIGFFALHIGGFIHIFLVIALIAVFVRLIKARKTT